MIVMIIGLLGAMLGAWGWHWYVWLGIDTVIALNSISVNIRKLMEKRK